jgi:hypothetical protein
MPIRDRVKELRRVRASELADNAKNWRVHPEHQRAALRGLLSEIGFAGAELTYYSQRNGGQLTLIDGHLRKTEAGDAEIPCLITDLNDDEADLLLLTYDPIAAMAEADRTALTGLLGSVHSENEAVQNLLKSLADGELVMPHGPDAFRRPTARRTSDSDQSCDERAQAQESHLPPPSAGQAVPHTVWQFKGMFVAPTQNSSSSRSPSGESAFRLRYAAAGVTVATAASSAFADS